MAESDVNDLTVGRGKYYLTNNDKIDNIADIEEVDALLKLALGHTGQSTAANFLIPGNRDNGVWKHDTTKQPFVQPVPEPATLLLLGSGLVGLGLRG